jgi:hypothetical protein
MGHYDEQEEEQRLKRESEQEKRDKEMIEKGYAIIPNDISPFLGNQRYIHRDTLAKLSYFINWGIS